MRYTTYAELKSVIDRVKWEKKMEEYREKGNVKKNIEKKENSNFNYEEEHKRIQELNRIYLEKIRNGEM